MDARDTTAANADLWACYLRAQWRAWLDPFGLSAPEDLMVVVADGAAANIAAAVSAMIGAPITRMYAENAPEVTAAVHHGDAAAIDDMAIPPEYARVTRDATQLEAWRSADAPPPSCAQPSSPSIPDDAVLAY